MSRGVNKVILVGNLGKEPEVRFTPEGNAIANLVIATSESWRDKQSGDVQDRTEWHRVVFFSRLAEIVGEGSLRTRKWTDRDNNERYTTEIVANEMHMLDRKGDHEIAAQSMPQQGASAPQESPKPSKPSPAAVSSADIDDDIPF